MRNSLFIAIVLSTTFFVTGCVNVSTANVDSGTNLNALKVMYVQQTPNDQRGVAILIADKLRTKGVQATTGIDAPKSKVDAVVSFKDVWVWDWSYYLLDLTVIMKDPKTEQILASGNSRHGTLTRLTPTEMVSEVIDKIYSSSSSPVPIETVAATQTQQKSNVQKLQDLKALLDQGVLTKSEYDYKRRAILDQM